MKIHELAEMLRGYPNTKVTLSLVRPSENRERTYTLTREIISIETVNYETLDESSRDIFFLFVAKCCWIATSAGVNESQMVVMKKKKE